MNKTVLSLLHSFIHQRRDLQSLQNKNISLAGDILILTLAHFSAASSHLKMPRRCAIAKIHLFTVRKDMIFYPACAAYTLSSPRLFLKKFKLFSVHITATKSAMSLSVFKPKNVRIFVSKFEQGSSLLSSIFLMVFALQPKLIWHALSKSFS